MDSALFENGEPRWSLLRGRLLLRVLRGDPTQEYLVYAPRSGSMGAPMLASVHGVSQNAVDQARCVAARLAGRPSPYAEVPWFWSEQGDLKLQMVGVTGGADRTVLVGDTDTAKFSLFCYLGDRFLGIESVNRPGDHMAGRRLMAEHIALPADLVAEEGFDLKAYVKAALT